MKRQRNEYEYRGLIGIILASSLGFFLFGFAMFAAFEAWYDPANRGNLSENATQVLSTAVGGIIGVLAGYVGGIEAAAARDKNRQKLEEVEETEILETLEENE